MAAAPRTGFQGCPGALTMALYSVVRHVTTRRGGRDGLMKTSLSRSTARRLAASGISLLRPSRIGMIFCLASRSAIRERSPSAPRTFASRPG